MADDARRVREVHTEANNAQTTAIEPEEALADGELDALVDNVLQSKLAPEKRGVGNKTPERVAVKFLALIEQGVGHREAATRVGIHLRTAQRLLARYDADFEAIQAATRKILAVEALDRVDDWRLAARVGAQKRGNHLPAKDWLLHAGVIDPLQGENQAGIRIAINIGTEERPMKIASPLTDLEPSEDH
jgi:Homeodomain-like domain